MASTYKITDISIACAILRAAGVFPGTVPVSDRAARATDIANNVLPADAVARVLLSYGHLSPSARTYSVFGVRCDRCNRILTDLDSIAAGVGPTCQAA
jgi:hypothetical protein